MLRFSFYFIFFSFGVMLFFIASLRLYLIPQLPDISELKDVKLQTPLRIYSKDHSLIAEFGEKRRSPVLLDDLPISIIQAFLAAEDSRFFRHPGVDWQGIIRAATHLIRTGQKIQGGSTITMQVARNFFLTREKTYIRKLREILLAIKIERALSKESILELYLNKIYLGHRSYGISAAAHTYYGGGVQELTLAQAAMLAALPKAPSTTNPITNPKRAKIRRNYILQRMLEEKFIDDTEYQAAVNTPITASLHSSPITVEAPYVAEMVRKKLIDEYGNDVYTKGLKVITTLRDKNQTAANHSLRKALLEYDERHGYRGAEHHYTIKKDDGTAKWNVLLEGFPVIGNLYPALVIEIRGKSFSAYSAGVGVVNIAWPELSWARPYLNKNQRSAPPQAVADFLQVGDVIRLSETDEGKWRLSQLPEVQGAFVSMNPMNGATVALVGGFDYQRSKFNRVSQALRQPGSGFKPFIYSAALAKGNTAATLINDAPVVFKGPNVGDLWRPENYSHKSYGPTRLREALIHSRNLASVRLLHTIGIPYALEHIAKFGFNTAKFPKNLSLALGSIVLTPWEMASGYCVFANGGYKIHPHLIESIETNEGEVIFQMEPTTVCRDCDKQKNQVTNALAPTTRQQPVPDKPVYAERVVEERNIWIMNSMTRDVIRSGTGRRAMVLGRNDLSGKTGTTNEHRDAWFAGFNPGLVAVAWVGFDNSRSLGNKETGGRVALPMWIEYMRIVLDNLSENMMPDPQGIVRSRINKTTGKLAQPDDPEAIFEVFRSEYAPQALPGGIQSSGIMSDNTEESDPSNLF